MPTTGAEVGVAAGPPSGRFVLRIPPELHGALKAAAARVGVSLNSYCRSILTTAVRGGGNGGMITAALVAALTEEFDEVLVGLVVFGSRIRNEHTATSDIDLLIAVSESVPVSRELYTRWDTAVDAVHADARVVSPHFAHLPSEDAAIGSLWLEVALHGVVVLDPTGVVARTLARVRDRIAAGEVQRRAAYGHRTGSMLGGMRNLDLVDDYLRRGRSRLRAIEVLLAEESWADVVRESQEVVEIALKALLRFARIDVPTIHDVSPVLDAHREKLPSVAAELDRLISISRKLRRDRELAFSGSEDLTPSQFYRSADAQEAYADAVLVHRVVAGACNRAELA